MDEEFSVDPSQLLEAASDFAHQPGALSDTSAQEFLTRFPLPAIISALQTNADYPGLENALVDCLERIFRTKYGASLIPHYMPFVLVGLGADSQKVRRLACVAILCLLENTDKRIAVQLVLQYGVYPLLLSCLIDGDEQVATASTDAIKNLAGYPEGMGIVFPASVNEATHLGNLAATCSSLGRVRVLALIVRLFSISSSVASEVSKSNLLSLMEAEVRNTNDTLVTLSVLEILYELVEVQHSAEFLSKTSLLQLLSSIISNGAAESILRSRAMMIAGRLLSKENAFAFIDESSFRTVLSAIERRFEFMESQEADECECALEALGQIGSSFQGATTVLSTTPPIARHVVNAAFNRQQHGKQLAALHSLGNIAGETRVENTMVLNSTAEENLRRLIYDKASKTSKLTPSGLLLSVLQQDSEIRIAHAKPTYLFLCSDEQVATASTDAIKNLAGYPEGMGIVFPASVNEATHLGNLAATCSSLGRVRVLALIVRLFSISSSVASEVSKSNLLSLMEAEVRNTNDTLVTLSVLEILYELVEVQHSAEFLSKTSLLQLLSSIISNGAAESILRSRAMMIAGRLLSKENAFAFIDESSFRTVLSAIERRFEFMESQEADECECALEALGQIGSSFQGATTVLSTTPPIARHVVNAAFNRQQHGKQLAALHSLGNIAGETRVENTMVLNSTAEENLRRLIYDKASKTSKLTPSGLLLSVLQQDSEIRIAGYRLISGLVARPWCLMEIISRPEIIDIATNTYTETTKIGMEARHRCCEAIYRGFTSSSKLISDPSFADMASKLQEAIKRGPYGARKHTEAQPLVVTADRF